MTRRWVPIALTASLALIGAAAIAQSPAAPPPILHEELAPPAADKPTPMVGTSVGSGNPAAVITGDKVLPRPELDTPEQGQPPPDGEPVLGGSGFAADRSTETRPDYNTGPDATLHYASVFNPDVLPFKRMSVLDAVAEDYTLKNGHTAIAELAVGGTTDRSRDRFWGSVLIKLMPGADVALPSVAPDMRILSYEVKPPVRLTFGKDGADNFYVRTDETRAAGTTYRLVFLADADGGYFAPSLPTGSHWTPRRVVAQTPPEIRPSLPAPVMAQAKKTLEKLGVDQDMDLGVAFNKLVGYFRDFQAKPAPPSTGDIYRDLCDSQAGVCRHRAFAFMVTANAIGIPTRFVENEAHAFVEVWFPERGWQRIDLGGAALRMEVTGADNKTLHRPRAEDPFAKPPAYKQNYTQLEGNITGLSSQQLADKRRSLDQAPASGDYGNHGGPGGPGGGDGDGSGAGGTRGGGTGSGGAGGVGSGTGSAHFGEPIAPDPGLPSVTADPKKQAVHLGITLADPHAYRGDVLHVEGRAEAGGKPLADHPIDIFLAPVGAGGAHPIQLPGRATTDASGTFRVDLQVPGSIDLKAYELFLSSPEDAYYNAALSD